MKRTDTVELTGWELDYVARLVAEDVARRHAERNFYTLAEDLLPRLQPPTPGH